MLNENLNNTPWKNKLEDEASLSGELLPDKEAAWQRLNQRLHQQASNRRVIWYWVAAACIMLAVAIPFLVARKPEVEVVQHTAPKATKKHVEEKEILPLKKDSIVVATPIITRAKKTSVKVKTESNISTVAVVIQPKELKEVQAKVADSGKILPTPVDDNSLTGIAAVQPRRKLKVVHINELGDPVEASTNVVHTAEPHSFELKLANGEVLNNTPVAYNKPHFAIIKIKSSPTN